ncbi:hypothetical protein CVT24_011630 [Panaeolus cyanescens]|uniref:Fe2OG dioxygenase domain-containing protein n=1 Tax=Panaeolus cyanescens TaxID=181874 RepID=A0A409YH27_9AGAR|nr:hypothetical protein CVT24_011630 [Panaeolus cyanescens]
MTPRDQSSADLDAHRVLDRDTFYIPNFITEQEEEYLLRKIAESPQPKWKKLANRRSTGAFKNSPHGQPNHIIMNEYLPGQGIMPHEDGASYFPVVATLSLQSHTVFHYYKYREEEDGSTTCTARSIDKSPVLSLLLEPRSLVISSGEMYTAHLHGRVILWPTPIDAIEEDVVVTDVSNNPSAVSVSNFDRLDNQSLKTAIESREPLRRSVRYSLTCRDIARVSNFQRR